MVSGSKLPAWKVSFVQKKATDELKNNFRANGYKPHLDFKEFCLQEDEFRFLKSRV
jgi:hypothetical protein